MDLITTYTQYTNDHFHIMRKDLRSKGQHAGMYNALAVIKASKTPQSAIECITALQDCLYIAMIDSDSSHYDRGIYDEYEIAIKIIRQWIEQNQ